MECERIRDLLSDFMDGSLPDSGRSAVSAHLAECRRCAEAAEELSDTIRALGNLPPIKAPPELLERIRREIAAEIPEKPLWKKLFLPVHIKIPLEAAAAVLLFLVVSSAQKREMPAVAPSPPVSTKESAAPAARRSPAPETVAKRLAPTSPDAPAEAKKGGSEAADARRGPAKTAASKSPPAAAPAAPASPPQAKTSLTAVPAQRASTSAERIEWRAPQEETADKDAPGKLFSAPPSRLMRPVPYGRDVTLEVAPGGRAGLEERIVRAASLRGGRLFREPSSEPAAAMGVRQLPDAVRVILPSDTAGQFIDDLKKMGTVPDAALPGRVDLPAGPVHGTVLYTVRIVVR